MHVPRQCEGVFVSCYKINGLGQNRISGLPFALRDNTHVFRGEAYFSRSRVKCVIKITRFSKTFAEILEVFPL
jgi:hypothetical protein